jgi:hypothetical protein
MRLLVQYSVFLAMLLAVSFMSLTVSANAQATGCDPRFNQGCK